MKENEVNSVSVIEELVERLKNSNRFEQAADLIIRSQPKETPKRIENAMDCYLKANRVVKAY